MFDCPKCVTVCKAPHCVTHCQVNYNNTRHQNQNVKLYVKNQNVIGNVINLIALNQNVSWFVKILIVFLRSNVVHVPWEDQELTHLSHSLKKQKRIKIVAHVIRLIRNYNLNENPNIFLFITKKKNEKIIFLNHTFLLNFITIEILFLFRL